MNSHTGSIDKSYKSFNQALITALKIYDQYTNEDGISFDEENGKVHLIDLRKKNQNLAHNKKIYEHVITDNDLKHGQRLIGMAYTNNKTNSVKVLQDGRSDVIDMGKRVYWGGWRDPKTGIMMRDITVFMQTDDPESVARVWGEQRAYIVLEPNGYAREVEVKYD